MEAVICLALSPKRESGSAPHFKQQGQTAIITGNDGEAGAIDLYGPALGLRPAISGVNTYWLRGYGDPPPQALIVIGLNGVDANRLFSDCPLCCRCQVGDAGTQEFQMEF